MGAVPSREAHDTLYSLRYGSHEVALIPLTRGYFGPRETSSAESSDSSAHDDDDGTTPTSAAQADARAAVSGSNSNNYRELKRQLVRVRNDPSIRYNHMHSPDCSMFEIPKATYTEDDLERFIDTVEASLFDTNAELLETCVEHHPTPMMAQRRKHYSSPQQQQHASGGSDGNETGQAAASAADVPSSGGGALTAESAPLAAPVEGGEGHKEMASSTGRQSSNALSTSSSVRAPDGASAPSVADNDLVKVAMPSTPPVQPPADQKHASGDSASTGFVQQTSFRQINYNDHLFDAEDNWKHLTPEWLTACMRFKRAVRPLPCAVVFLYVSGREEVNSFSFHNRKMNVIGYFGCRTHENTEDDDVPYLQVRKAILKAAGDRTLERVMTLGTKCYLEQFTEMAIRYQAERSLPGYPLTPRARAVLALLHTASPQGLLSMVLARASMVVTTQWNNYPVLKFLYEAAALVWSREELKAKDDPLCLETYQKPNGEKGLILQFNGNLLARAWLWVVRLLRPSQRRSHWAQFILDEHAQQKDQEVSQWLAASADAKVFMAGEIFTSFLVEHLDRLHTEIVRARETPQDDTVLWMANPELSHDGKLYRIFNSPYCGPFLTTVKGFKDANASANACSGAAGQLVESGVEKKRRKASRKDRVPVPHGAATTVTTPAAAMGHHGYDGRVDARGLGPNAMVSPGSAIPTPMMTTPGGGTNLFYHLMPHAQSATTIAPAQSSPSAQGVSSQQPPSPVFNTYMGSSPHMGLANAPTTSGQRASTAATAPAYMTSASGDYLTLLSSPLAPSVVGGMPALAARSSQVPPYPAPSPPTQHHQAHRSPPQQPQQQQQQQPLFVPYTSASPTTLGLPYHTTASSQPAQVVFGQLSQPLTVSGFIAPHVATPAQHAQQRHHQHPPQQQQQQQSWFLQTLGRDGPGASAIPPASMAVGSPVSVRHQAEHTPERASFSSPSPASAPSTASVPYVLVHDPRTGTSSAIPLHALSPLLQVQPMTGMGSGQAGSAAARGAAGPAQNNAPPPTYFLNASPQGVTPVWTAAGAAPTAASSMVQAPSFTGPPTSSMLSSAQMTQGLSFSSLSAPLSRAATPFSEAPPAFSHQPSLPQQAPLRAVHPTFHQVNTPTNVHTPPLSPPESPVQGLRAVHAQGVAHGPTPPPSSPSPAQHAPPSGNVAKNSFTVRAFNA